MACNCNSCEDCETCGNCSSDCESTSCEELQTSLAETADKINYLAVFQNVPAPLLRDTLLKLECDLASLATMVCEGGATTIDWSSVTEKPFDTLNLDDFTVVDGVLNIGGDLADPVTIEDVSELPSAPDGDSNTFYRLPDGTVYVLNQVGDGWVDLTGGGSATTIDWSSVTDKPFDTLNPDDFTVVDGVLNIGESLEQLIPFNGGVLDNTNFVGIDGTELTYDELDGSGWAVYSTIDTPWLLPAEDNDPEYPIISVYTSGSSDVAVRSAFKLVPADTMVTFAVYIRIDDISETVDALNIRFYSVDHPYDNTSYGDTLARGLIRTDGTAAADIGGSPTEAFTSGAVTIANEWQVLRLSMMSPSVDSIVTGLIYNNHKPTVLQAKRPTMYLTPQPVLALLTAESEVYDG